MVRLTVAALAAAVMITAGCGGASSPVPDVAGERLDVAKAEMDDAGYDTEEIGGGAFGIVVESNWTVCETDPPAGSSGDSTVKLIIDRSCESTAASDSSADTEPQQNADGADPTPEATPKPKRKPKPKLAAITVPGVVGMDHQAAQNRMQAAGLYLLDEVDATGEGRSLLWDRNWVVVRQSPSAGRKVDEDTTLTLFSVKDGEQ